MGQELICPMDRTKLKQILKAAIMILMVGSVFLFSSATVQKASEQAETSVTSGISTFTTQQFNEVLFLTYLLSILAVSVYILVMILAHVSGMEIQDFLSELTQSTKQIGLV